MIELMNADQLANQIERARALKPRVRYLHFRHYEVQGSHGDWYTVRFFAVNGRRLASCSCPAGQHDRPCYHIAAALPHHLVMAAQEHERLARAESQRTEAERNAIYCPPGRHITRHKVRGLDV